VDDKQNGDKNARTVGKKPEKSKNAAGGTIKPVDKTTKPKEKNGKTNGKSNGAIKPKTSISSRCGILFPVGRVRRHLRAGAYAAHIGMGASIYVAATLEYLVAEILELAGNATKENNKQRVTPRYIQLAVRNDHELDKLFQGVTISEGGVLPNIHKTLLPIRPDPKEQRQMNEMNGRH